MNHSGKLPSLGVVAISALDDPDLGVANDAAVALGRWGTAKAEPALWARLSAFTRNGRAAKANCASRPTTTVQWGARPRWRAPW